MNFGDNRRDTVNISELKKLTANATEVVNWYPYMEINGATVRGPWNRWFQVLDNDSEHVSSALDDCRYAAASMNAMPRMLQMIWEFNNLLDYIEQNIDSPKKIEFALSEFREMNKDSR